MDLRQLRYFLAVAQTGSVRAAARVSFVTAPAVSIQLRALQEHLGERLFVRRGNRLELSAVGLALVPQAEALVRRLDDLRLTVTRLQSLEQGLLRIGNIDAAATYILPALYQSFRSAHPGVDIRVVLGDSRRLVQAVRGREVELAVLTLPVEAPELAVRAIYEESMVAVARPDHVLCRRRRVPLQELARAGLITYPAGSTTRRLIDSVFLAQGVAISAAMEVSSPEAIKSMAEAGLGPCILPEAIVADALAARRLRPIRVRARFSRRLGLVHGTDDVLSPAARAFAELLVDGLLHRHRRYKKA